MAKKEHPNNDKEADQLRYYSKLGETCSGLGEGDEIRERL